MLAHGLPRGFRGREEVGSALLPRDDSQVGVRDPLASNSSGLVRRDHHLHGLCGFADEVEHRAECPGVDSSFGLIDDEQAGAGLLKNGHDEAERAERAVRHIEGVEGQLLPLAPFLRETHGKFVAMLSRGN